MDDIWNEIKILVFVGWLVILLLRFIIIDIDNSLVIFLGLLFYVGIFVDYVWEDCVKFIFFLIIYFLLG